MTSEKQRSPQEEAKLNQIRAAFQKRKQIDESLSNIKHKIGVYSGKGGVGKTTVSVNLAVSLASKGYKVAIFDVDIDCPNVTNILHHNSPPSSPKEGVFIPSSRFDVKVMSMAFFHENEEEATIWRGPMIIENFSGTIFGSGAGREISEKFNIPMIGSLSLNGDYGKGNKPTVLTNTTVKEEYNKIIEELSKELID